jgi:phosphoribosylanthranilate isomerase
MWVKICGNTNEQDALAAVEAGADALGFIIVPSSRRSVSRKKISEIMSVLPSSIMTVGVVANEEASFLKDLLRVCRFRMLQFHGNESPEEVLAFKGQAKLIKAIRVKDAGSLAQIPKYKGVDAILLESYHPDQPGGTGIPFDWNLALQAKQYEIPLILAGGLTPTNVHDAVRQVNPYGVDVVSGVEREPGIKDPTLVRSFIVNAK